jgi:AbrB family looped-hinge helix DNA binding protein
MLIQTSTITQKGQVTIPLFIRQKLALAPGEKVSFFWDENRVGLRKVADFFLFVAPLNPP